MCEAISNMLSPAQIDTTDKKPADRTTDNSYLPPKIKIDGNSGSHKPGKGLSRQEIMDQLT